MKKLIEELLFIIIAGTIFYLIAKYGFPLIFRYIASLCK